MLIHSNATVNIARYIETDGTKSRNTVKVCYPVYINSRSESVIQSMDSQGAYKEFMMMTGWDFSILIGDKIVWGTRNFVVQWGENFSDLTGIHGQYILQEVYD